MIHIDELLWAFERTAQRSNSVRHAPVGSANPCCQPELRPFSLVIASCHPGSEPAPSSTLSTDFDSTAECVEAFMDDGAQHLIIKLGAEHRPRQPLADSEITDDFNAATQQGSGQVLVAAHQL